MPTVLPTAQAQPTPTASPQPAAWLLLDEQIPDEVAQQAETVAIEAGLEVHRRPIPSDPQVPAGLTAVVAAHDELAPVRAAWSEAGVLLVVLGGGADEPATGTSVVQDQPRRDQEGFLSGVAAGLATSTRGVGLMPGDRSASAEAFRLGFSEGLLYACARCRLEPVEDMTSPPFGVDVVGLPPGSTVVESAPAESTPWIVVATGVSPGAWTERRVLELSVSSGEVAAAALRALLDGASGSIWILSVENGGLAIGWINPAALSPGRERLLRQAEGRLVLGLLAIGGGD